RSLLPCPTRRSSDLVLEILSMDLLASLALGLQVAVTPVNLLYCLLGVTLGTAIVVLPGVGPIITISLLLPLTFGLTPEASIIMRSEEHTSELQSREK